MIFRNNPLRLKAKFRIIKKDIVHSTGIDSQYIIQRRLFFFWYVSLEKWLEFFQDSRYVYVNTCYESIEKAKQTLYLTYPIKQPKVKKDVAKPVTTVVFETNNR